MYHRPSLLLPSACDGYSALRFFSLYFSSLSLSPHWVFLGGNYSRSGQSVFLFLGFDAQTPGPGWQVLPRNRYLRPKRGSAGAAVSRGGGVVGEGVGVCTPTIGLGMGRALLRELGDLGSSYFCPVTLGKSLALSGPHLPALHNEGRTW